MTLIKDIMTKSLYTVDIDDNMLAAAEIFQQHDLHHIPVMDKDCIEGLISKSDFERIKHGMTLFRNPNIEAYNNALYQSTLVRDVMSKNVESIRADDDISVAYKIFKENKHRCLPVVDKGLLVGIITPLDLLDYFFSL